MLELLTRTSDPAEWGKKKQKAGRRKSVAAATTAGAAKRGKTGRRRKSEAAATAAAVVAAAAASNQHRVGHTCHLCMDTDDGPHYDLWHVLFECPADRKSVV